MEPGTITLDRESFKALASEVRVEVLKQLESRRMTVTDLSHVMNLAKPTLLEHLDRLVSAGLVTKIDEGRKWVYYELTGRGRNILHPHQVKIMISLTLSFVLVGAGIVALLVAATNVYDGTGSSDTGEPSMEDSRPPAPLSAAGGPSAWGVVLVVLGMIPLFLALWYWRAGRDLIGSIHARLPS